MSPEETRYHDIFDKSYSKILTYVRAQLYISGLSGDLAEDLTQSVFQTLWIKWDENRYKTDEILLKWLYNTANNKLLESRRSEDAVQHENIDEHERDLVTPGGIPDIDEQLSSDVRLKELEALLGPQLSQLLILISDGYKYRECSRILGIPIGTVGVMLNRLRKQMKKPENRKKIEKILK